MCSRCRNQSLDTTRTNFEKTRTPLRVWLVGAWYATNQKLRGQTAGTMFHRFRRAVVRPERERLHGLVEVEEIYLAITDRQLRAAGKGASATLPRCWPSKR